MPGPRYVKEFEYPAEAGFTGSRNDRVAVRPHVRRYAEGGRVTSDEKLAPKPVQDTNKGAQKTPAPQGDTVQSPKVGSTVDTLKNRRAQQMKELGLKKGGEVKVASTGTLGKLAKGSGGAKFAKGGRKYAEGGAVLGHSAVQRSLPTTEGDQNDGGKTPLRPGFKAGGGIKARATVGSVAGRDANLKKMSKASMGGPIKLAAGGLTTDAKDSGKMGMTKVRKMKSTEPVKRARGGVAAGRGGAQVGLGPIRPQIPAVMPGRPGMMRAPATPMRGVMTRAKGGKVNY